MKKPALAIPLRPQPHPELLDDYVGLPIFTPAPELVAWIHSTFVDEGSPLENERHSHLRSVRIGALWTNVPHVSRGNRVVGTAEIPRPPVTGGKWGVARWEAQLNGWFGSAPDFILTFDASAISVADDVTFCAIVEHELYHCGQATDEFGAPRFFRDGRPMLCICGHDVEEFVGIVQRYGVAAAAGQTAQLAWASRQKPSVGQASIAAACGVCRAAA